MKDNKIFSKTTNVTLYHGSCLGVEFPAIRRSKFTKDFSWGFYTTSLQQQAEKWANRHFKSGVVSKYEYIENNNLNIQRFDSMTDEWLDFIVDCRKGQIHNYDVVEGPMADDTIYNYIDDFIAGLITREAFWVLVKFKYPAHQLSFHTLSALSCLKFIGSYEVNKNGI